MQSQDNRLSRRALLSTAAGAAGALLLPSPAAEAGWFCRRRKRVSACVCPASNVSYLASPAEPAPSILPTSAVPILWSATDYINGPRVLAPDRAVDFVFFGFMVDTAAYQHQEIKAAIWPRVAALHAADTSIQVTQDYRPTGIGGSCVVGYYSAGLGLWNFVAIAYHHVMDNPNARFSRAYDIQGNVFLSKWGWDPNVIIPMQQYRSTLRYADADRELGVHFAFLNLVKV